MEVQELKEALEAFIKNELPELQKMEDYYNISFDVLKRIFKQNKMLIIIFVGNFGYILN